MNQARACFASLVVDNLIYVYGGISGQGTGKEAHYPTIANPPVERYNPINDKWEVLEIQNATELAAFAWCQMGNSEIYILGGTDGSIIQEAGYKLDFKKGTFIEDEHMFDQSFAMNKLLYREK
jgi:N-acetylneuraminic acid mutarotase